MDTVRGTIRRRILVNFRVDPDVAQRHLPDGFVPKLSAGYAVAGVCLVRLEHERPHFLPRRLGLSSENAAHRYGAYRTDERGGREDCVYMARRHSGSLMNVAMGGRIFPGDHHAAHFRVRDTGGSIDLSMSVPDGYAVELHARRADSMPAGSVFASLSDASCYFRGGSLGYSETRAGRYLDGLRLTASRWEVAPLDVALIRSSYFDDPELFPQGTIEFDSALLMTDIEHEWRRAAPAEFPLPGPGDRPAP